MSSPQLSFGDTSVADRSMATQLFKEGRALLDQGRVAPACRKLEESERLGPGGGTLLNLALCHEKEGRTATAWVEFTEALGMARRDDRQARVEFARAHLAQLEPILSRLSIQVPSSADLPDLEIRRDGSIVGRAAWGSPVPVDPGDHLIEVGAPGKLRWKQSVVMGSSADSKVLVVPALEDAPGQENAESTSPAPPPSEPAVHPVAEARGTVRARPEKAADGAAGTTVPAWIFLGIGIAAAGTGATFATLAVLQKRDADRNCPNDVCSADGARQNSEAIRDANYATIGLGVGLAGVGLGTILFATRSSGPGSLSPATSAAPRARGLEIAGGGLSLEPNGAKLMLAGRW